MIFAQSFSAVQFHHILFPSLILIFSRSACRSLGSSRTRQQGSQSSSSSACAPRCIPSRCSRTHAPTHQSSRSSGAKGYSVPPSRNSNTPTTWNNCIAQRRTPWSIGASAQICTNSTHGRRRSADSVPLTTSASCWRTVCGALHLGIAISPLGCTTTRVPRAPCSS